MPVLSDIVLLCEHKAGQQGKFRPDGRGIRNVLEQSSRFDGLKRDRALVQPTCRLGVPLMRCLTG